MVNIKKCKHTYRTNKTSYFDGEIGERVVRCDGKNCGKISTLKNYYSDNGKFISDEEIIWKDRQELILNYERNEN